MTKSKTNIDLARKHLDYASAPLEDASREIQALAKEILERDKGAVDDFRFIPCSKEIEQRLIELLLLLPLSRKEEMADEERIETFRNSVPLSWRADTENRAEIVSVAAGGFGERRTLIFPAGMLLNLAFQAIRQMTDVEHFAWEENALQSGEISEVPKGIEIDIDSSLSEEYKIVAIEQLIGRMLKSKKSFDKLAIENFFGDISCRPAKSNILPTTPVSALREVEASENSKEKNVSCITDVVYFTLCYFPLSEKHLLRMCNECGRLYFPSKVSQKRCWFRSSILEDKSCKEAVRIISRDEWNAERDYRRKIAVLRKSYDMRKDNSAELLEYAIQEKENEFANHLYKYKELSAWATEYKQANKRKAGRKKGK